MSSIVERIKGWLGRTAETVEDVVDEATPAATPPAGVGPGDSERETSTNAQMEGAAGQPWPGDE